MGRYSRATVADAHIRPATEPEEGTVRVYDVKVHGSTSAMVRWLNAHREWQPVSVWPLDGLAGGHVAALVVAKVSAHGR